MRQQRAFGLPGGAAGVDQDGGVFGQGLDGREHARVGGHCQAVVHVALALCLSGRKQGAQGRAMGAHSFQTGHGIFIGDGQHGLAVLQPEFKGVRPEQNRQRHGHRPHLQHRHVGHRCFKALRQHNGHAVTAAHTQRAQRQAQCISRMLQVGVAVVDAGGAGAMNADGRLSRPCRRASAGTFSGPALAAGLGDIEVGVHLPAKTAVQRGVLVCPLRPCAGHVVVWFLAVH